MKFQRGCGFRFLKNDLLFFFPNPKVPQITEKHSLRQTPAYRGAGSQGQHIQGIGLLLLWLTEFWWGILWKPSAYKVSHQAFQKFRGFLISSNRMSCKIVRFPACWLKRYWIRTDGRDNFKEICASTYVFLYVCTLSTCSCWNKTAYFFLTVKLGEDWWLILMFLYHTNPGRDGINVL